MAQLIPRNGYKTLDVTKLQSDLIRVLNPVLSLADHLPQVGGILPTPSESYRGTVFTLQADAGDSAYLCVLSTKGAYVWHQLFAPVSS